MTSLAFEDFEINPTHQNININYIHIFGRYDNFPCMLLDWHLMLFVNGFFMKCDLCVFEIENRAQFCVSATTN